MKRIFIISVLFFFLISFLLGCTTTPRQPKVINFGKEEGLEISLAGFRYVRGNFSFFLPDPKQRFTFFVRELTELTDDKSFDGWLNGEIVRITDKNNLANTSLFLFNKNKVEEGRVAENNLNWYVGRRSFLILKKSETKINVAGRTAIKRVMVLDINNHRRCLVQAWFDIDPVMSVLFSVHNYGVYSDEPSAVLGTILGSVRIE